MEQRRRSFEDMKQLAEKNKDGCIHHENWVEKTYIFMKKEGKRKVEEVVR